MKSYKVNKKWLSLFYS